MNERIDAVLDGDLPRSLLSPEEEIELSQMEAAITAAAERVRGSRAPELSARVMANLPEEEAIAPRFRAAVGSAWRWFWTPREIAFRPAAAMLALVLLLMVGRVAQRVGPAASEGAVAGPAAQAEVFVQFRLEVAGASHVSLAGSFTGWEAGFELYEVAPGLWSALVPLRPGVHDYLYIVDGERWVPDPLARPVDDGFGGVNSRLFLAPPAERV
jgi:hypothetical protein